MIYTRRSVREGDVVLSLDELGSALEAGFDLVDVEAGGPLASDSLAPFLDRVILSLHDFDSVPPLDDTIRTLRAQGAAHIKIAVMPRSFDEDREILACLARHREVANLSLFGMGSRGLYSRTLAPSLGSRLAFVALDEGRLAAPGQLPLGRAAAMWEEMPSAVPERMFAVVGNPASHSQSPRIHNGRFRRAGLAAAYGIIETDELAEVLDAMEQKRPCAPTGLSVTAPFKRELVDEALRRGWSISERAQRVEAANTVVVLDDGVFVDNTDVLGFARALERCSQDSEVAIIGGGGTARAAALAASDRRLGITVLNRTLDKAAGIAARFGGKARSLDDARPPFDVVINTLPDELGDALSLRLVKTGGLLVRASYGGEAESVDTAAREKRVTMFGGLELLEAQADEQSRQFIEAAGGKP